MTRSNYKKNLAYNVTWATTHWLYCFGLTLSNTIITVIVIMDLAISSLLIYHTNYFIIPKLKL